MMDACLKLLKSLVNDTKLSSLGSTDHPVRPVSQSTVIRGRSGYRRDIDGLRSIAVLAVVLFHCNVYGVSGGFVGVDVFFVISGFLITSHLAADVEQGRLSILRFYAARIRRIVPALFVTLIATWCAALVLFLPSYLLRTSSALIAAATSVSNIYFWKSESYFGMAAIFQPYLHTWSLSVEEQFYAIIPVAMLVAARLRFRRWPWLFGAICLVSFALSVYATTHARSANFYLLPTRAWELGVGSVLATVRLPALTARWAAEAVAWAGLLLLAAPITLFDSATPFPGVNALYPCLGSALIIYAGTARRSVVTALLSTAPFVWIGLISYSLYLVHWPLIVFVRYYTVEPLSPLEDCVIIAASTGLAVLSWRFIEMPFRRPSPAITPPRLLIGAAVAVAVASLVGVIGVKADGFPDRFPTFTESAPPDEQWMPGRCFLIDANYHDWSAADCTRVATGPHKILLWGDSFAAQFVPGLIAHADTLRATIIQYTAAGCVPVLDLTSLTHDACTAFNAQVLRIIREQKIDTVMLAGRWTEMAPSSLGLIRGTLVALRAAGVRVVMLGQAPEFAEDVHVIGYFKGSKARDAVNRWDVLFNPTLNDRLADIARGFTFINPTAAICTGKSCTYEDKGVFLYSDFGHMSPEGSRRAVEAIIATNPILRQFVAGGW
jgi:peptidoglycan/LPS O-acetylase OafA/YrhL